MTDIKICVNQGRYDRSSKKLLVIRENAIRLGFLDIQDSAEQRLKKCYPKIYQRLIGPINVRYRNPKFRCYCNDPKSLESVCKDILENLVPNDSLTCDDCWKEDLTPTWGYFGFTSKVISKDVWQVICDKRAQLKFVE